MFLNENNIPIIKNINIQRGKEEKTRESLLNFRNEYILKIRHEQIISKIMNERFLLKKQNINECEPQINKNIQEKFYSLLNENDKIEFLSLLLINDIENLKNKFNLNLELNPFLTNNSLLYLIELDDNNIKYIGQKKENFVLRDRGLLTYSSIPTYNQYC